MVSARYNRPGRLAVANSSFGSCPSQYLLELQPRQTTGSNRVIKRRNGHQIIVVVNGTGNQIIPEATHDRKLYPRAPHNHQQGESAFDDLSIAKPLLYEASTKIISSVKQEVRHQKFINSRHIRKTYLHIHIFNYIWISRYQHLKLTFQSNSKAWIHTFVCFIRPNKNNVVKNVQKSQMSHNVAKVAFILLPCLKCLNWEIPEL